MANDFLRRLRELDETFAGRPIPARVHTRTLERLREAHARRRVRPWVRQGLVLGFVTGVAATWLMLRTPATSESEQLRPTAASLTVASAPAALTIADITLTALPCELSREADIITLPAACELSGPGLRVATLGPTQFSSAGGRLRVLSGDVRFDVEPRDRATPLALEVSSGIIEVIGTRFLVHEDGARGRVDLYEGRLRFVGHDGAERFITPGQSHEWGGESPAHASTPPPEDVAPRKPAASRPAPLRSAADALEISRRATAQRHRGAHAEAARELAEALRAGRWPRATAEVWSYELGTLYADELGDRATACAHWLGHQKRFGEGPYAQAVAASMKRLECEH